MDNIIKKIASLYVEGYGADKVIKELCLLAYDKDCPWCDKGIFYDDDYKVEGLCDCITEQFKE